MNGRSRGRPPRDPIDQLRARIWYWHVRGRSDLSDYALSRRFAPRISSANGDAPKAFERIRRRGVVPSDGNHQRRDFSLVARVDADPEFRGTRDVYESPFWDLVRNPSMNVNEIRSMIDRLMVILGLARPSPIMWGTLGRPFPARKPDRLYREGLKKIVAHRNLNALALLAALFREALLFVELQYAMLLQNEFERASRLHNERLRALGKRTYLARFRDDIERDLKEFEQIGGYRLLMCSAERDRTNLFEDLRVPLMNRGCGSGAEAPTIQRFGHPVTTTDGRHAKSAPYLEIV